MDCIKKQLAPVSLATTLESLSDFWAHWGFEPWRQGDFAGVARRQRFVKSGLLGPVAEYAAWEAIIWACGSEAGRAGLWRACKPLPGLITQRFWFLLEQPDPKRKIRSFCLGLRGYVEFYSYWPAWICSAPAPAGSTANPKVRDLAGLVDLACNLARSGATTSVGADYF